jgi:hypothetical protein
LIELELRRAEMIVLSDREGERERGREGRFIVKKCKESVEF